jgi:hypothetical protein
MCEIAVERRSGIQMAALLYELPSGSKMSFCVMKVASQDRDASKIQGCERRDSCVRRQAQKGAADLAVAVRLVKATGATFQYRDTGMEVSRCLGVSSGRDGTAYTRQERCRINVAGNVDC